MKDPQQLSDPISENLQKLAALFPAAVKDGILDIEALREELGDEGWQHQKIMLEPRSNQPEFEKLFFDPSQSEDLQVLGEFVTTL